MHIANVNAEAQRSKPFSVEEFAKRMTSFIIKKNTYANTKAQIFDVREKIKQTMQRTREVGMIHK